MFCQIDFKISKLSGNNIKISIIPSADYNNVNISGIEFTVNVPNSVSIVNSVVSLGLTLEGENQNRFVSANANTGINLMTSVEMTLATFSYAGGSGLGNFTISPTRLYFELNGIEAQRNILNNANNILLPITLKSLTAQKFDETSALLEWTSASEVDASHYEVERSFDAQAWSYVSTERVRGGNKQEASYTYLDRLGLLLRSKPNIVYYRLKLVDLDGSYKYSDVRSVAFEELAEIAVNLYPNPASGQFQFAILSKDGINTSIPLILTDMTGKTVLSQNVTTNAITTISTLGLPVGVYHAQVTVDGQSVTKKVVISN